MAVAELRKLTPEDIHIGMNVTPDQLSDIYDTYMIVQYENDTDMVGKLVFIGKKQTEDILYKKKECHLMSENNIVKEIVAYYKYIQGRRLTLAARELVETKKPITEIAYEAHYNSQQAFTLAFHQLYLCTPQTYRKEKAAVKEVMIFFQGYYQTESYFWEKR